MLSRNKTPYKSIPFSTLLHVAGRNLLTKKLRSSLTIVGIVIGIGAIFFLLSFGIGLRDLVTNEIIGNTSVKSIDITSPNSKIIKIDQNNIGRLKKLPHSARVGASYSFPGIIKLDKSEVDGVTYGVDQTYLSLLNINITAGRTLKEDDAKSIVLNRAILQSMGYNDDKAAIGKKVSLTVPLDSVEPTTPQVADEFTVVGVTDSGSGSEIFVPSFVFENAGVAYYSQAKLVADQRDSVSGLRAQIESLGLLTSSPIDTIQQVNDIFRFLNLVLVGFGAIGMVVAILGMFNTLTISLLERTREIGLMIALGTRNRDVKKMFIIEALILSMVGAVTGIILAILSSLAINIVMNLYAEKRGITERFDLFATPIWLIAGLILFMMSVGYVVAYFPARRAEKINPIDALRRE